VLFQKCGHLTFDTSRRQTVAGVREDDKAVSFPQGLELIVEHDGLAGGDHLVSASMQDERRGAPTGRFGESVKQLRLRLSPGVHEVA
jgi:hypothetical protein